MKQLLQVAAVNRPLVAPRGCAGRGLKPCIRSIPEWPPLSPRAGARGAD